MGTHPCIHPQGECSQRILGARMDHTVGFPWVHHALGGLGGLAKRYKRRQKTSQTSSCERGLPSMQRGDEHRTENRCWESRLSISGCFFHVAPLAWNLSSLLWGGFVFTRGCLSSRWQPRKAVCPQTDDSAQQCLPIVPAVLKVSRERF